MENDLLYLLQRYTVQIAVTSQNYGTSSEHRYYTATVSIQNGKTQLSMSGSAHGGKGSDAVRQEAIAIALGRVVTIAKSIEEAY